MNYDIYKEKELQELISRYERRDNVNEGKYELNNPYVYFTEHVKEKAILKCFNKAGLKKFNDRKLLEIGCGGGNNILFFLKLGFEPENIYANELLESRIEHAKKILPVNINFYNCDARYLALPDNYFDIVFQSVVFTSILNSKFKIELAKKMWNMVKPGGAVLWVDFIYDNPYNHDVKGIGLGEIKNLFPEAKIKKWKIILAPPIGRYVTRITPALYNVFNFFPVLRTHLLCWIYK